MCLYAAFFSVIALVRTSLLARYFRRMCTLPLVHTCWHSFTSIHICVHLVQLCYSLSLSLSKRCLQLYTDARSTTLRQCLGPRCSRCTSLLHHADSLVTARCSRGLARYGSRLAAQWSVRFDSTSLLWATGTPSAVFMWWTRESTQSCYVPTVLANVSPIRLHCLQGECAEDEKQTRSTNVSQDLVGVFALNREYKIHVVYDTVHCNNIRSTEVLR